MAERRRIEDDRDGVDLRAIAAGAAAVAAAIVFAIIAADVALWVAVPRDLSSPSDAHRATPPKIEAPQLQPAPELDIAAFRAEKARLLEGYAWVDAEHGIVRIPIERAMALRAGGVK